MPSTTERLLLGTATVLMGLIAGFFYAYACSVMVGLARVDDGTFITTMQGINATVRNAAFAPSFFGALAVTGIAALVAYRHRSAGRAWILGAFALYAAAFAITMGINVPLNEQLAAAGPATGNADVAAVRAAYEGTWVAWNIARAALSTAALVALVFATFRVTIPLSQPARTASR
jgi:uncharacterized membrane protein